MHKIVSLLIAVLIVTVACQPAPTPLPPTATATPTPFDPSRIPSNPFNPICDTDPSDETPKNSPLPSQMSKGGIVQNRDETWRCLGSINTDDGVRSSLWARSLLPYTYLKEVQIKSDGSKHIINGIVTGDYWLAEPPADQQIQINAFEGTYRVYPFPKAQK